MTWTLDVNWWPGDTGAARYTELDTEPPPDLVVWDTMELWWQGFVVTTLPHMSFSADPSHRAIEVGEDDARELQPRLIDDMRTHRVDDQYAPE